jgi:DNA invertase Pin-like site-specific DNA recombinase
MPQDRRSPSQPSPTLAAKYVRMSTEHQQYSIDNQADAISRYAREHNMEIVRTYVDSGKSGLTIENRPGLRQLIADVEGGLPGFTAILVYDVSRWGRFQDVDESAYYEYRCRRAKIALHYCAEQFNNDGSTLAALVKTLKRTMAAEYSRELSAKVFAGQCRLTELGFRQGGTAGYGFRRLLIDQDGNPKCVLQRGEQKSILTDRVILIPGPREEVEVVKEIFQRYVVERRPAAEIARMLNERGILGEEGQQWTRYIVHRILTNPKYMGVNVTNRQSGKLRSRRVNNPPEIWVRKDGAFEAIIDGEIYHKATAIATARYAHRSDDELLEMLRGLLQKHGRLSGPIIKESRDVPCPRVFSVRFGGLAEAYRRIGYTPYRNLAWVERDGALLAIRREFTMRVIDTLKNFGASVQKQVRGQFTTILTINEKLRIRLSITRCRTLKRIDSWRFRLRSPLKPDVTIAARLAPGNGSILDYFCIPPARGRTHITVSAELAAPRDVQRFDELGFLQDFAEWGRPRRRAGGLSHQ